MFILFSIDFLRDSNEATECDYAGLKKARNVSRPPPVKARRVDEMLKGLWDELEAGHIDRFEFLELASNFFEPDRVRNYLRFLYVAPNNLSFFRPCRLLGLILPVPHLVEEMLSAGLEPGDLNQELPDADSVQTLRQIPVIFLMHMKFLFNFYDNMIIYSSKTIPIQQQLSLLKKPVN